MERESEGQVCWKQRKNASEQQLSLFLRHTWLNLENPEETQLQLHYTSFMKKLYCNWNFMNSQVWIGS